MLNKLTEQNRQFNCYLQLLKLALWFLRTYKKCIPLADAFIQSDFQMRNTTQVNKEIEC